MACLPLPRHSPRSTCAASRKTRSTRRSTRPGASATRPTRRSPRRRRASTTRLGAARAGRRRSAATSPSRSGIGIGLRVSDASWRGAEAIAEDRRVQLQDAEQAARSRRAGACECSSDCASGPGPRTSSRNGAPSSNGSTSSPSCGLRFARGESHRERDQRDLQRAAVERQDAGHRDDQGNNLGQDAFLKLLTHAARRTRTR